MLPGHPRRSPEHTQRAESTDAALGHVTVKAETSYDIQKISVPDRILSADEMTEWAKDNGFGHGKRGTFHTDGREAYLYVKHCLSVDNEADVEPALAMARHLTAAGILHPATRWGVYKRADDDFQLFPVSPGINAMTNDDLYEDPDGFSSFRVPANAEGSHLLEWCRRVDPDYTPTTKFLRNEKVPEGSLVRVLNLIEASYTENWGYDENGMFYPVDVEVIQIGRHMDIIRNWYAAEQAAGTVTR